MKKIAIAALIVICPVVTNAMLPRLVAKKLPQIRKFSTGAYDDEPMIRNALGQVIIGVPAGWFGATIGGICGTSLGFVIGLAPAYILENGDALEKSTKMGTLIGGTAGGWLSASIVTGPRGAIACGTATVLLQAWQLTKFWNSLSEREKQQMLGKFR